MGMVDMVITRIRFPGRKSRSVNISSKCSDFGHLGPDCERIGSNIDFCRLKATSVEKKHLSGLKPRASKRTRSYIPELYRFGSCREGSVSNSSVSFHAPHQSCPTIPFRSVSIASRVHQFRFVPYPLPHRAHEFRFVPFRIWHVSPPFRFVSVRPYHSASDSVSFRFVSKRLYRFIPFRFLYRFSYPADVFTFSHIPHILLSRSEAPLYGHLKRNSSCMYFFYVAPGSS
jgi:hypothetical protein